MDFGYLYTSFEGRINRKPYWLATILLAIVAIVLGIVIAALATFAGVSGALLTLLMQLLLLYPSLALLVKRLHDRNHPGWWAAFLMVPVVLQLFTNLLGITGNPLHMNALDYLLMLASFVVAVWFFIELGCMRGTVGPNDYGPDPLGAEVAIAR